MNPRLYIIGTVSVCAFTLMAAKPAYEQGVVLIKFKAKVDVVSRESVRTRLAAKVLKRYDMVGLEKWRLGKEVDALAAAEQLAALPGVQYAQPNYLQHIFRTPNDPRYSELWGLHNTDHDADIDAPAAWDIATGNNSIIVAVVDSGVDYTHPDLKSNMWRNPDEIPLNGIDDDHNGYVDDVYGIDACNGDTDPMDDKDHGTHCSGTIAGLGNNGVGVVGVCWSARIMACKFLGSDGSGSTADAIECIQYATRMGARVINASWGGGPYEKAMFDAIGVANKAGILFCAAAGNEKSNNDDAPSYPSSYDNANILAVAATDDHDQLASFSCYGASTVDLAAPGVSILSTVVGGDYKRFSGTSMATPHCSGAAALLLSVNPQLSVTQLKAALMNSAVQKPALFGRCQTGARLNAFRAIQQVADPAIICPTGRKRKGTHWQYKSSDWAWKYNDGHKSDRIIGKRVTPALVPYLTNGWRIGIAQVKDNSYYPFGPVYKLATQNNKSWSLKIKKNIKILYNAKSGAFTCTIWTQLPSAWVVYVSSGNSSYRVVDVSGGPSATKYPVVELLYPSVLDDDYKTTKILLRTISAGTFTMGAPSSELGRFADEGPQHSVTLASNFYMGVFEITQAQYLNVMGVNPSFYNTGAYAPKQPVEQVSWNMVRGGTWPGGAPTSTTFMGTLRRKTGLAFDLPTEAQWEYACRAGTTRALNNNTDLVNELQDPNMDVLGRYWYNGGNRSDPVVISGSYLVNQWGLYDMHGNVWEWCLDWYGAYASGSVIDPGGPPSGAKRVVRGGNWEYAAWGCRSAFRGSGNLDDADNGGGFRVALPAGQ